MAIQLAGLEWAAQLVGVRFPDADEDALWRCARAWHTAAEQLRLLVPVAMQVGGGVADSLRGEAATRFGEVWQAIGATDGVLGRLANACDNIATSFEHAAAEVERAKLQILAELAGLVAAMAAFAAAVPGVGIAGGLVVAQAVATARLVIRAVLVRLLRIFGGPIAAVLDVGGLADQLRRLLPVDDKIRLVARVGHAFASGATVSVDLPGIWAGAYSGRGVGRLGPSLSLDEGQSATYDEAARLISAGQPSGVNPEETVLASSTVDDGAGAPSPSPDPVGSATQPASSHPPQPAPPTPATPTPTPLNAAPPRPSRPAAPPATPSPAALSSVVGPWSGSGSSASGAGAVAMTPRPGVAPPPAVLTPGPAGPPPAVPGPPSTGSPAVPGPAPTGSLTVPGSSAPGSPAVPSASTAAIAALVGLPSAARALAARAPSPSEAATRVEQADPAEPLPPLGDAEALTLARTCLFVTGAGYGFYPPGDENRDRARALRAVAGEVTLDVGGDADGFLIDGGRLTPSQFASVLRVLIGTGELTVRSGECIRLVVRRVADGPPAVIAESPAAALARDLGIDVVAPDGRRLQAHEPTRTERNTSVT